MASSLSDEEFSRMQVLWQNVSKTADLVLTGLIFTSCSLQTQLIELRTLNYELEGNCQRHQAGQLKLNKTYRSLRILKLSLSTLAFWRLLISSR